MQDIVRDLYIKNEKKIVLLVMDGVGGLPREQGGKTELETAKTPNLDALAAAGECGLHLPIGFGITPGSAPGHLALFGYQPTDYPIGRGVVAALGIGFPIQSGDVAVRVNFATRDAEGRITDRRAGRIPTEKCAELCELLSAVSIPGVQLFIKPVKDYRAVVIFRGEGLSDHVEDTDPQATGVKPRDPKATSSKGEKTAGIAGQFIRQALELLKDRKPANAILMRGFAELPHIPSMQERFGLDPVALAVYPDYKGVSRLVGMDVVEDLQDLDAQAAALRENWDRFNFFFVHHKYTDSKGEDGDFEAKVAEIEKVDRFVPRILEVKPDVLLVTGDHSTPAVMRAHSAHPVPFLLHAGNLRADAVKEFGERNCAQGLWGVIPGAMLIRLLLSAAEKLAKFGA
ncbi:MAG: 2,3-bisphosphoglycerate-independent phosphoglycerate mutase [Spirochaetaceae bacterium]|nr:MAG: 2,3-bisphosphoglycerate-independent phosphoglycerate mutase [Spirochaetaceae bacterium]